MTLSLPELFLEYSTPVYIEVIGPSGDRLFANEMRLASIGRTLVFGDKAGLKPGRYHLIITPRDRDTANSERFDFPFTLVRS